LLLLNAQTAGSDGAFQPSCEVEHGAGATAISWRQTNSEVNSEAWMRRAPESCIPAGTPLLPVEHSGVFGRGHWCDDGHSGRRPPKLTLGSQETTGQGGSGASATKAKGANKGSIRKGICPGPWQREQHAPRASEMRPQHARRRHKLAIGRATLRISKVSPLGPAGLRPSSGS
jgi:hypothetical protein